MKAIILAAGFGNRMRPLTDHCHKTMLSVGGKTIIQRIIDGLEINNITDIVVVTGYRAQELTDYLLATFPGHHFSFVHNDKYRETNNIYSLALAFEHTEINDDIIIIESDLIFHPEVLGQLIASPHKNVALLDKYRSGMDGTVVTVNDGIITNVIPPHLQPKSFDFSDKYKTLNIYKFSRMFCETSFKKLLVYYANVIDKNCYYELILGILIYMQKEIIHAELVAGETWSEVDDPNDLHVAEFDFNLNRKDILEHAFGGYWNYNVTDFCFIRNMHFPNTAILSEMRNALPELLFNYGSRQSIIDKKLSWFLLCKESCVTALNGASQIYPMLRLRFRNSPALLPAPTFGEYLSIFTSAEYYADDGEIDLDDVKKRLPENGVVVFVNPNNPTGTSVATDKLYNLAAEFSTVTFIIDESFIEFSPYQSIISLLEDTPLDNIIVIKSLSKSLGIPGLRIGYVYSSDADFNRFIKTSLPIWNMNSMAEYFLEVLLKHRNSLRSSITQTIDDREEFRSQLAKITFVDRVYKSGANFILVRFKSTSDFAGRICDQLLIKHSSFVKNISGKFTDGAGYVRLAVRTPEENSVLCSQIQKIGESA